MAARGGKTETKTGSSEQAAHQVVAIAAFLAGADVRRTDTEDIAVKANEIAPGRFTWRRYPDQISLEDVYKHLWDLTKSDKGALIKGSKKGGWLLTEAGIAFAEQNAIRPKANTRKFTREEERWISRERPRMIASSAFQKIRDGRAADVSKIEAERFFRIDDYIVDDARRAKLERVVAAFREDPELSAAVQKLASMVDAK